MKYEDIEIHCIGELIESLKKHIEDTNVPVWYRGQARSEWMLLPKFFRQANSVSEIYQINRFKQNATILLQQKPMNDFEWMFLMQHYSMSTRLLDWSESPLTALYFAIDEFSDSEAAIWMLLPCKLNEKSNYRPDFPFEIPSFEDEILKNYLPETVASEHRSRLLPIAAIAPRNNQRMQSQQGVFTISHRDGMPINLVGENEDATDHIWRYLIPGKFKPIIKSELNILGITRFQLFPDLDSLAIL